MVGTPHFMAPEVINRQYSEKCDVWAIGVITYMLFSQGSYPFEGENETNLFKNIKRNKILLPSD